MSYWVWGLTPVILALWEAEVARLFEGRKEFQISLADLVKHRLY